MSELISFNGTSYIIPDVGDESWGQNVTDFLVAIPQGCLQKVGGAFTLTADVNFGGSFGLLSAYFKTRSVNPASAGLVRLSNSDLIEWRNAANSGNNALGVNSSDQLTYNGVPLEFNALTSGHIFVGNASNLATDTAVTGDIGITNTGVTAIQSGVIFNAQVSGTAAIAYSKLNLTGQIVNNDIGSSASIAYSKLALANSIVNADIASGAVIALNKLAALSASKLAITDSSGFLTTESSPSLTEIGYVAGVTSAIQTQIDAITAGYVTSITGTANQVIASASTGAVTLSTPQSIGTTSSPTFGGLSITTSGTNAKTTYTDGTTTFALGISHAVGDVVIGTSDLISQQPFRWNPGTGVLRLGDNQNSVALTAVSNTALGLTIQGGNNLTLGSDASNLVFKDSTTNTVSMRSPASVTTYSLVLPAAQASGANFLKNDGSGNLSWATPAGSGTVNSGTAGRLSLYAASTTAVSDTYVQNTKNITLAIAAQGSRSADLAITIPNPGNAVTSANVLLDQGTQTVAGATTFSSTLTMGATIAMGANKITGVANGTASTDAAAYGQVQYLQPAVQGTLTSVFNTTSNTYAATGLSATIVPTSASSRIKITVSGSMKTANAGTADAILTVKRGTTDISPGALGFALVDSTTSTPISFTYIDSPATTSSTVYQVFLKNDDNTTQVTFNTNAQQTAVIIVEEIR